MSSLGKTTNRTAVFAAVFAALYAGHHIGDQWVQTHHQALTKGRPDDEGRQACATHVATLTATKAIALASVTAATGMRLPWKRAALAIAVDAASHYWADRRTTLAGLADLLGKGDYYRLGAPRKGHDDNVTTGTGAYHLDQAWHTGWILVAAAIIAGGES